MPKLGFEAGEPDLTIFQTGRDGSFCLAVELKVRARARARAFFIVVCVTIFLLHRCHRLCTHACVHAGRTERLEGQPAPVVRPCVSGVPSRSHVHARIRGFRV